MDNWTGTVEGEGERAVAVRENADRPLLARQAASGERCQTQACAVSSRFPGSPTTGKTLLMGEQRAGGETGMASARREMFQVGIPGILS